MSNQDGKRNWWQLLAFDLRTNLILHPNQKIIHEHPARFKAILAGKRFGKTKWALFELCQQAARRPGEVFWCILPTYGMAKNIGWWELEWLLPKEIVKRSVENELMKELINGARIKLLGSENQDALRGPKLGGVILDEAAYEDQYIWTGIISGQLLGGKNPSFAYFISSPNRRGRNWFSNFWDEAKARQDQGDPDWAAFKFTIYDNPTINKKEIDDLKANTPDDTWDLEYMGIESNFAGTKFSEFQENLHTSEQDPPAGLPTVRGIDWGLDHPSVCLWAKVDLRNKCVYIYDEYVKSGAIIQEHVSTIEQKTGKTEIDWTVIDPSANRRDPATNRSVKDEFMRWGLGCVDGDRRDRGTDITKMFFKKNLIKIHPKCKNLRLELKNLQWGDKVGDDCTDALRYLLVRVHDSMFGGNILDAQGSAIVYPVHTREININDPNIFPQETKQHQSWILQEIEN